MRTSPSENHLKLIRKLESISDLSDADRSALADLPLHPKQFGANREVVGEGERPSHCCLLLDGFMHRYKTLPDGGRQVLSYHLPGDIPDLLSVHLETMDHSLGTVTATEVAFIPHSAIRSVVRDFPGIASAFWRDTLIDAAVFREWIVNVGARAARARIAHLLSELFARLGALGLAEEDGFLLPLTQVEIADATGHVGRARQPEHAGAAQRGTDRLRRPIPPHPRLAGAAVGGQLRSRLPAPEKGAAGMNLALQPVAVAQQDGDGMLVFAEGRLAAVLVRLSELHEGMAGGWFLEIGFGTWNRRDPPVFESLDAAQDWIAGEIGRPG